MEALTIVIIGLVIILVITVYFLEKNHISNNKHLEKYYDLNQKKELMENAKKDFNAYMSGYIKGKEETQKKYGKILIGNANNVRRRL